MNITLITPILIYDKYEIDIDFRIITAVFPGENDAAAIYHAMPKKWGIALVVTMITVSFLRIGSYRR